MSTDGTTPTGTGATGSTTAGSPAPTTTGPGTPDLIASHPGDPAGPVSVEDAEPGWITRHTTLLITLLTAVIVAAVAVTGLVYFRAAQDDRNADTEAAFAETVAAQGAALETVECDGDTCAAIVGGQAYTVLVQEDENGEQHFGVSAYVGD
ncbi:hypothetical protein [Modestobacter lapidis]|nr:hypothetical protein [Modestobacter lapidis]